MVGVGKYKKEGVATFDVDSVLDRAHFLVAYMWRDGITLEQLVYRNSTFFTF